MGATSLNTPQLIGVTGSVAGSLASGLLPILGATTGPVGLLIGGAITGVAALLSAFNVGGGCGQSCIVASQTADQIEAQLKQNLALYQAGQISRDQAVQNFQVLWAGLEQSCRQIGGDAGHNCIADRQEGACKWKDDTGQCWNWFKGYRDPIATSAPVTAPSAVSMVSNLGFGQKLLLGIGAAVVLSEALS
jgi:hypothetical protein